MIELALFLVIGYVIVFSIMSHSGIKQLSEELKEVERQVARVEDLAERIKGEVMYLKHGPKS